MEDGASGSTAPSPLLAPDLDPPARAAVPLEVALVVRRAEGPVTPLTCFRLKGVPEAGVMIAHELRLHYAFDYQVNGGIGTFPTIGVVEVGLRTKIVEEDGQAFLDWQYSSLCSMPTFNILTANGPPLLLDLPEVVLRSGRVPFCGRITSIPVGTLENGDGLELIVGTDASAQITIGSPALAHECRLFGKADQPPVRQDPGPGLNQPADRAR